MVYTEIAGPKVPLGGCHHVPQAQVVTIEHKVEAARRVIDPGRTIAEVARDLGLSENLLGRWVADEGAVRLFGMQQFSETATVTRSRRSGSDGLFGDLIPHLEPDDDFSAVIGGSHTMAERSKVRGRYG